MDFVDILVIHHRILIKIITRKILFEKMIKISEVLKVNFELAFIFLGGKKELEIGAKDRSGYKLRKGDKKCLIVIKKCYHFS